MCLCLWISVLFFMFFKVPSKTNSLTRQMFPHSVCSSNLLLLTSSWKETRLFVSLISSHGSAFSEDVLEMRSAPNRWAKCSVFQITRLSCFVGVSSEDNVSHTHCGGLTCHLSQSLPEELHQGGCSVSVPA